MSFGPSNHETPAEPQDVPPKKRGWPQGHGREASKVPDFNDPMFPYRCDEPPGGQVPDTTTLSNDEVELDEGGDSDDADPNRSADKEPDSLPPTAQISLTAGEAAEPVNVRAKHKRLKQAASVDENLPAKVVCRRSLAPRDRRNQPFKKSSRSKNLNWNSLVRKASRGMLGPRPPRDDAPKSGGGFVARFRSATGIQRKARNPKEDHVHKQRRGGDLEREVQQHPKRPKSARHASKRADKTRNRDAEEEAAAAAAATTTAATAATACKDVTSAENMQNADITCTPVWDATTQHVDAEAPVVVKQVKPCRHSKHDPKRRSMRCHGATTSSTEPNRPLFQRLLSACSWPFRACFYHISKFFDMVHDNMANSERHHSHRKKATANKNHKKNNNNNNNNNHNGNNNNDDNNNNINNTDIYNQCKEYRIKRTRVLSGEGTTRIHTNRLKFGDSVTVQVSPNDESHTPIKASKAEMIQMRRLAERNRLYRKLYGKTLPVEYHSATPPGLTEALDEIEEKHKQEKMETHIKNLRLGRVRSADDDALRTARKSRKRRRKLAG